MEKERKPTNFCFLQTKSSPNRNEYNVYITFHSHEPEFDYLKSLEIEEKINQIRWLKRKNPAHFLLSTNGKEEHDRLNFLLLIFSSASNIIFI